MHPNDTLPSPAVPTPQHSALYTQHDITSLGAFSKSHLYNLIARGHFPAPALKMGPRFTRWSASAVEAWLCDPAAWVAANAKSASTVPNLLGDVQLPDLATDKAAIRAIRKQMAKIRKLLAATAAVPA